MTLQTSKEFIEKKIGSSYEIAIILGTGLNSVADLISDPVIIPFRDIPGFSVSTAPSHEGKLIAGEIDCRKIIILQGRLHYYEGYSMDEITFPVKVLKSLGISTLIITNAAGSLNEKFQPGELVLINDHINFLGNNPLIGKNFGDPADRFPSMNEPYDAEFRNIALEIARNSGFKLHEGVYVAVSGPSLETRAECRMFAKMGADLVGMSTVPEVIVAIQSKMRVLVISAVTNMSNIFHSAAHSQEEIWENAEKARENIETLLKKIIIKL
ncbi:MAG: purine-nucleoside phosphorylase [Candidatus Cloacimonetes bacterium]|nr:purine-nucleoside phosphorylase [Candidatus Cloacimonadota bacterium]